MRVRGTVEGRGGGTVGRLGRGLLRVTRHAARLRAQIAAALRRQLCPSSRRASPAPSPPTSAAASRLPSRQPSAAPSPRDHFGANVNSGLEGGPNAAPPPDARRPAPAPASSSADPPAHSAAPAAAAAPSDAAAAAAHSHKAGVRGALGSFVRRDPGVFSLKHNLVTPDGLFETMGVVRDSEPDVEPVTPKPPPPSPY